MRANLSRLGLGTVQWGLTYGVANVSGRPAQDEVERMLKAAADSGVNWLDTARMYGESEEVIGRALKSTGLTDKFLIVSKTCQINPALAHSEVEVRRSIREGVAASLKALGVRPIPVLLAHKGEDILIPGVWDELLEQKEKGNVESLGVSISRNPVEVVERVLAFESMEALQVAVNVFDQRLVRPGMLRKASAKGVTVFVRSAYLQGLIVMPDERVPAHLACALRFKKMVSDCARAWGRSVTETALQFVLGLPGVTAVVVGCETEAQVRDNVSLVSAPPLTAEQMKALLAMPDVPLEIVEPWRWEGSMKPYYAPPGRQDG